ncbi:MAG: radical SAM protein [Deltaproteobacteria bacterium]|nr:radical SAM protein [Deltaproteobacteria bacterium]
MYQSRKRNSQSRFLHLGKRVFRKSYEKCRLCPRQCNINRLNGNDTLKLGFCGETDQLRVGYIGPHFGEEPPITGRNGSGTVFLSGCSLKCSFCQNHQLSHQGLSMYMGLEEVFQKLEEIIGLYHIHNINFVTPDHFFPHIFRIVSLLRKKGFNLPVVFNTSGYQSVDLLRTAERYADIYLPDFKYSDSVLAANLSKCPNYPQVALDTIAEMVSQKGFLDICRTDGELAQKGVLVRHLIIPGHEDNSINALSSLFVEFGRGLPLSLMSQYHPVRHHNDNNLNRFLSEEEFNKVYSHALDLGFEHLFVQFPDKGNEPHHTISPYLPDFRQTDPFE